MIFRERCYKTLSVGTKTSSTHDLNPLGRTLAVGFPLK